MQEHQHNVLSPNNVCAGGDVGLHFLVNIKVKQIVLLRMAAFPAADSRAHWYLQDKSDLSVLLEENLVWFSLGFSLQSLILPPFARKSLLLPTGASGMCCLFTFSLHPTNLPTPQL